MSLDDQDPSRQSLERLDSHSKESDSILITKQNEKKLHYSNSSVTAVTRIGRALLWLLVTILILLAIAVTALRIVLPRLNQYQNEIVQWVTSETGFDFRISNVQGYWHNARPAVSLQGLQAQLPENTLVNFSVQQVDIEFDLLTSLLTLKPQVTELKIDQLNLDISHLNFAKIIAAKSEIDKSINDDIYDNLDETNSSVDKNKIENKDKRQQADVQLVTRLDKLFLHQFEDFSLTNSTILYPSWEEETRRVDIEVLKWRNHERRHQAAGTISFVEEDINSLSVSADFYDNGSLLSSSGTFYLQAYRLNMAPWLNGYLKNSNLQKESVVERSVISFNSWLTFAAGKPIDAYVELLPSELLVLKDNDAIEEGESQQGGSQPESYKLSILSAVLKLSPNDELLDSAPLLSNVGWQVRSDNLKFATNDKPWPELDIAFRWHPQHNRWLLNLSQLDLVDLLPLVRFLPNSESVVDELEVASPSGLFKDIRVAGPIGPRDLSTYDVAQNEDDLALTYSMHLTDGAIKQWQSLPAINQLELTLQGKGSTFRTQLTLNNNELSYDKLADDPPFKTPLTIQQVTADFVWQQDQQSSRLWAEKVKLSTPDLELLGAFRLDFPKESPAFLSLYAEIDLLHAAQIWRYLPTQVLGDELAHYLSTAIQAGEAKTAKLLWYGGLNDFPYSQHNGQFQALVNLKKAKFEFEPNWPMLSDLQLDLLFENNSLYFDSHSAKLLDVSAQRITGQILKFGEQGRVEIEATVQADGRALHDYMMASPLADSVGAALTELQISGLVNSTFQLDIPFDPNILSRVWGEAKLDNNSIAIQTLPIKLNQVSGLIRFDDEKIRSTKMVAMLLDQPITLNFNGKNIQQDYVVNIDASGDWMVKPLHAYIASHWLQPLDGHAKWNLGIDFRLQELGASYQIALDADLTAISSHYPAPLQKDLDLAATMQLKASGNQDSISARIQLPQVKYQALIDITSDQPQLTASNLVLGTGNFKSELKDHQASLMMKQFDADSWITLINQPLSTQPPVSTTTLSVFDIPFPTKIDIQVDQLTLATMKFHQLNFSADKKEKHWLFNIDSAEIKGKANYIEPYDLSVVIDYLYLYIPALESASLITNKLPFTSSMQLGKTIEKPAKSSSVASDFDRSFFKVMPNLTLTLKELWVQGYKVGNVNVDLQRKAERLEWKKVVISSGTNEINIDGWWTLTKNSNDSQFNFSAKGKNNSDLMERFGISSGVQRASFNTSASLKWNGAPWSMDVSTLNGNIKSKLKKGIISNTGGAARLLGLFSLDSIIRKMQLDFSDIFDNGMVFDSIIGSGTFQNGLFVTNDLKIDAVAGEMTLKGIADLNQGVVDAEVTFTPDMASGIPVLSAFAVTPQTALYVLAVTTVISPVVEVFTKVNYEIKGDLGAPTVKEISRSKGEFTLPSSLTENDNTPLMSIDSLQTIDSPQNNDSPQANDSSQKQE